MLVAASLLPGGKPDLTRSYGLPDVGSRPVQSERRHEGDGFAETYSVDNILPTSGS